MNRGSRLSAQKNSRKQSSLNIHISRQCICFHKSFSLCCLSWRVLRVHPYFMCRYTDPVDGSTTSQQGLILNFEYPNGDPSRVVFRLSGTGSAGATIRMYLERFEKDVAKHGEAAPVALKTLADRAIGLVNMQKLTGRDAPTVIT